MGFFEFLKKDLNNTKEIIKLNKSLSHKLCCKVYKGASHIFTNTFTLGIDKDGQVLVNMKHKVRIIACVDYVETENVKSFGKKVAGAAVGGILTGGVGAIVGAVAVGNNGKKVSNYLKLVAVDENNYTHEVILFNQACQKNVLTVCYIK